MLVDQLSTGAFFCWGTYFVVGEFEVFAVAVDEVIVVKDVHVEGEGLDDLRGHVLDGADGALELGGGDGLVDGGTQVEITELDGQEGPIDVVVGVVGAQDVLGLEVAVSDASAVQVGQSGGQVLDDGGGLALGEADPALDLIQQGTPFRLLKHQVELVLLLKVLDHLDDLGLALQ